MTRISHCRVNFFFVIEKEEKKTLKITDPVFLASEGFEITQKRKKTNENQFIRY